MTEFKIKRLNELAHKAKTEGLTEREKEEQSVLRAEYIMDYRNNFINIMENTRIKTPDGKLIKPERVKKQQDNN